MSIWSEKYYGKLEKNRHNIPKSDFRFYNLSHLFLLSEKTEKFSMNCTICKSNLKTLNDLADMLPKGFQMSSTRKIFEQEKTRIEKHLQKEHKVYYIRYYYSLYSLAGILSGIIFGFLLSVIILNSLNLNFLLIAGIIGSLIGQILGKRIELKKYRKNLQI